MKTIIRPTFSYSAPVWIECAQTHRKRLQVLQNKILKIMLNKCKRTPTIHIHHLADIELVQDYLDKLNTNFLLNCRHNINTDINLLVE